MRRVLRQFETEPGADAIDAALRYCAEDLLIHAAVSCGRVVFHSPGFTCEGTVASLFKPDVFAGATVTP
jgi:hypothetical protein